MGIEEIRKKCEEWDEDIGCLVDYPEECPYHVECAEEEGTDEGVALAS
jgi:hypothetical protein